MLFVGGRLLHGHEMPISITVGSIAFEERDLSENVIRKYRYTRRMLQLDGKQEIVLAADELSDDEVLEFLRERNKTEISS